MARRSAINVVAEAVVTTLNVASIRELCPGGVYRNRPQAQTPPFLSIGPCMERSWDTFGVYGAQVEVPVRVETSGADANGESRAVTILDAVLARLDDPTDLVVTGWTVHQIRWDQTVLGTNLYPEGVTGYAGTVTLTVLVRQA